METIDLLSEVRQHTDVAKVIMNGIGALSEELQYKIIEKPIADVQLIINGVEIPVIDTLKYWCNDIDKMVEERAQQFLLQKLKGNKLKILLDELENMEWKLEDLVKQVLK